MKSYYSSGKLLLTGEYVVLDGAKALAIPTHFGQHLTVEKAAPKKLFWKSLDEKGNVWFETVFEIKKNEILCLNQNVNQISKRLLEILRAAKKLNSNFLNHEEGYSITTTLEFPKNWGLGTSSTLINNIANWASINAYSLLEQTFGGSGYDIACARSASAIIYQLIGSFDTSQDNNIKVKQVLFNPSFKKNLYFVYLNKKQNSREGIAKYKKNTNDLAEVISEINSITEAILSCNEQEDFDLLIERHEKIIAFILNQKPIKEVLFNDFSGSIKSLGAWGGDFILVSSKTNPKSYFKDKGYNTILTFDEMCIRSF